MQITVSEAGRKGGLALLGKRGRKHFVEIGKKGQEEMRKRYPGMASEWGKEGGRPRKNPLVKNVSRKEVTYGENTQG